MGEPHGIEEAELVFISQMPDGIQEVGGDPFLNAVHNKGGGGSFANRVDSISHRVRMENESRGYNQVFAIDASLPLFYNQPIGNAMYNNEDINEGMNEEPAPEDIYNAREDDMIVEEGIGVGDSEELVVNNNEVDQFIMHVISSNIKSTSNEWPIEEWDSSMEQTIDSSPDPNTGSEMSVQNVCAAERKEENKGGKLEATEDHWEIITCIVLKQFENQGSIVSDSVIDNNLVLELDMLGWVCKMPVKKTKGYKYGFGLSGKGVCKRKANSNPEFELVDYRMTGLEALDAREWNIRKKRCRELKGARLVLMDERMTESQEGDNFASSGGIVADSVVGVTAMGYEGRADKGTVPEEDECNGMVGKENAVDMEHNAGCGVAEIDPSQSPLLP